MRTCFGFEIGPNIKVTKNFRRIFKALKKKHAVVFQFDDSTESVDLVNDVHDTCGAVGVQFVVQNYTMILFEQDKFEIKIN